MYSIFLKSERLVEAACLRNSCEAYEVQEGVGDDCRSPKKESGEVHVLLCCCCCSRSFWIAARKTRRKHFSTSFWTPESLLPDIFAIGSCYQIIMMGWNKIGSRNTLDLYVSTSRPSALTLSMKGRCENGANWSENENEQKRRCFRTIQSNASIGFKTKRPAPSRSAVPCSSSSQSFYHKY